MDWIKSDNQFYDEELTSVEDIKEIYNKKNNAQKHLKEKVLETLIVVK